VSLSRGLRRGTFWCLLILTLAFLLFPLVWMALGSFKTQVDFMAYPPRWLFRPTLANYEKVLIGGDFLKFTWNSLVIAAGSTAMSLLLGVPAAYGIARYHQTRLGVAMLAARMAPGIAFLIPWFIVFSKLRMVDTYPAVMLTHMVVVLPLVIWVLVGFFEDLPRELEESGLIDGCSVLGVFRRIALPLARPGIVATAILGVNYPVALAATGGIPPYKWGLTEGSVLPTGITLASTGQFSGVPTIVNGEPPAFTVQATDSDSPA